MPELAHMLHGDLLFPNIGVSHCLSYNGKDQPNGTLPEFLRLFSQTVRCFSL